MKLSLKKKSRWERAIEPIAKRFKGKTLNGKSLNAQSAVKPAARAVGGLLVATAISAAVSSMRGEDGS
jgi:hypothetical protein